MMQLKTIWVFLHDWLFIIKFIGNCPFLFFSFKIANRQFSWWKIFNKIRNCGSSEEAICWKKVFPRLSFLIKKLRLSSGVSKCFNKTSNRSFNRLLIFGVKKRKCSKDWPLLLELNNKYFFTISFGKDSKSSSMYFSILSSWKIAFSNQT